MYSAWSLVTFEPAYTNFEVPENALLAVEEICVDMCVIIYLYIYIEQPHIQWVPDLLPGGKAAGAWS